jgi:hypothetical protein
MEIERRNSLVVVPAKAGPRNFRAPDAAQRASGAPLIRGRSKLGVCEDPGFAKQRFTLHRAREKK